MISGSKNTLSIFLMVNVKSNTVVYFILVDEFSPFFFSSIKALNTIKIAHLCIQYSRSQ